MKISLPASKYLQLVIRSKRSRLTFDKQQQKYIFKSLIHLGRNCRLNHRYAQYSDGLDEHFPPIAPMRPKMAKRTDQWFFSTKNNDLTFFSSNHTFWIYAHAPRFSVSIVLRGCPSYLTLYHVVPVIYSAVRSIKSGKDGYLYQLTDGDVPLELN